MINNEKMKQVRLDADETQDEIAKAMNTTQQQYAKYESGIHKIPADRLLLFCQHYGVSSDYIFDLPKTMKWPR